MKKKRKYPKKNGYKKFLDKLYKDFKEDGRDTMTC